MLTPVMSPGEAAQHAAFTALLWALSYPGRPQSLPAGAQAAFRLIGATLLDLETGYFTPDPPLATALAATGGRALPPHQAPYHFYPSLDAAGLDLLATAPLGTYSDPDRGATIVIGCQLGAGPALTFSGPGVRTPLTLRAAGLPPALWALRNRAVYPLGWDLLLVAGDQVVGLPRTTRLEVA